MPEYIQAGAGNTAFPQGSQQGHIVQHRPTGDVDDKGFRFQTGELGPAHEAARFVIQRGGGNHKIGFSQDGVKPVLGNMGERKAVVRLVRRWSPAGNGQDTHVKAGQAPGQGPPNAAITNNGDGFTFEGLSHR